VPTPVLAILGCGRIARRHARAARRLGRRVALAFASRDPARARAYAREFGAVAAFGTYQDAVRDPRVAGVIICTPHDRHLPDALLALAHDRHVLIEKPIARTLDEADQMIEAARAAGRILMVAENFRYMPAYRQVRAFIDQGALGDLRELHVAARGFRRHAGWRLSREAMGGGALIDGGIHYVDNLRYWGGRVHRVFALSPPKTIATMEGEDAIGVLAELEGGAVGVLVNSLGTPGIPRAQWSMACGSGGACFAGNRGRVVVLRGSGRTRVRLFLRDHRGHQAMLAEFLGAITTGAAPEMDGLEGRRDLSVVLAVYRSIAEGRPVDVEA
jgi:UDP-N-acetyl-2-amino-2-deoxyglucuronate dehydrogenase